MLVKEQTILLLIRAKRTKEEEKTLSEIMVIMMKRSEMNGIVIV